jgi:Uncharacterized phage-associated protein
MSLGIEANKNKIADLLVYLSSKVDKINLRKLLKLVYLIDVHAMEKRAIPISWLEYKVWQYGPVSPEIYDIKNNGGAFADDILVTKNDFGKYIISPKRDVDLKQFSKNEMRIIEDVISKYGNMTADELSDLTHEDGKLWGQAVKTNNIVFTEDHTKTDIIIDLKSSLKDESARETYNEARECVEFQAALNRA